MSCEYMKNRNCMYRYLYLCTPASPSSSPPQVALTIGDELNKLASNIGFGRGWAGIHYRMDIMFGIKLGEDVAIHVLQQYKTTLPYLHTFEFKRYDGTPVII